MAQQDLLHSDLILIQGSSMAEAHPVGFRFVVMARERGATVVHIDPRYSRTSALADLWRADPRRQRSRVPRGADPPRDRERAFLPRVRRPLHQCGAARARGLPRHRGPRRALLGLGSGRAPATRPRAGPTTAKRTIPRSSIRARCSRCSAAISPATRRKWSSAPAASGARSSSASPSSWSRTRGRERTAAICYAVGWTQHTKGVQVIRAAAILQLLLGNIGRPGGGILALRGHASIQGSTDIPTLYNMLPGYLPMPHPEDRTRADYRARYGAASGQWAHLDDYLVSYLRATYGAAATETNDFGYGLLPRIVRDHCHLSFFTEMADGDVEGLFVMGQNPGVAGQHAGLERPRARAAQMARGARAGRDRDRQLLARLARGRARRAQSGVDRHRGLLFSSRRRSRREGRHLHQHPAPPAVAREGGGSAGRRAQRDMVPGAPRTPVAGHGRALRRPRAGSRATGARLGLPPRCAWRTGCGRSPGRDQWPRRGFGRPAFRIRRAQERRLGRAPVAGSIPA